MMKKESKQAPKKGYLTVNTTGSNALINSMSKPLVDKEFTLVFVAFLDP
jgi:hypothetical protein